jgi:hypothetical protein
MRRNFAAAAAVMGLLAAPAHGQQTTSLVLELNALTATEAGCRITFLATNQLGAELTRAAVEVAFFGAGGGIERLVSLDFKTMPAGKTKVLQFDLAGLSCEGVSRVLVNDVVTCEGEGLEPRACLDRLETRTATAITFGV